jgi:hypothetical protein
VVTRRAALAAGAAGAGSLLAGCGQRPPAPAGAASLLGGALAADRAALGAYRGLAARAPAASRVLVARMRRRTRARVRALEAAGVSAPAVDLADPGTGPRAAVRAEQAAAVAYVEALGGVRGERRALAAAHLASAAEHVALLGAIFGIETDPAFPAEAA